MGQGASNETVKQTQILSIDDTIAALLSHASGINDRLGNVKYRSVQPDTENKKDGEVSEEYSDYSIARINQRLEDFRQVLAAIDDNTAVIEDIL